MPERKERDGSYPNNISRTKSKRYVAVCPVCDHVVTISPTQFRIQASQQLRNHLAKEHQLY